MDGLLSLVRDAGSDPFDGALYVFRAKRADRIKIVFWDGSGVCLYAKRLEKAQFCWPKIWHSRVQLNQAQLMALVDGMDWSVRYKSSPMSQAAHRIFSKSYRRPERAVSASSARADTQWKRLAASQRDTLA